MFFGRAAAVDRIGGYLDAPRGVSGGRSRAERPGFPANRRPLTILEPVPLPSTTNNVPQSGDASHARRQPTVVIAPARKWVPLNFRELWTYRDLLLILAGRDVKLRYKQTALGVVWVILQPLIAALLFALIFGKFAQMPSDGQPYVLFVFCGMLPWTYFSGALQRGGGSLIADSRLITKVYFPRILIPIASTLAVSVDLAVSLVVLVGMMLYYHVPPTWRLAALPLFIILTAIGASGASLWLSAVSVKYRDFVHALPFIVQIWLFASPIAYAASVIPLRYRGIYSINPVVGFVEGFRWSLLGRSTLTVQMAAIATAVTMIAWITGAIYFRRVERSFADVI